MCWCFLNRRRIGGLIADPSLVRAVIYGWHGPQLLEASQQCHEKADKCIAGVDNAEVIWQFRVGHFESARAPQRTPDLVGRRCGRHTVRSRTGYRRRESTHLWRKESRRVVGSLAPSRDSEQLALDTDRQTFSGFKRLAPDRAVRSDFLHSLYWKW
jgi:hypothetical protein